MLFRLLITWLLNLVFGNPDRVQQDRTTWPTWMVVLLMLMLVGGGVGAFVALT